MTSAFLSRLVKLEARRRPVARIERKAERDARVTAWVFRPPDVMPTDPQKRAAILAATRADT